MSVTRRHANRLWAQLTATLQKIQAADFPESVLRDDAMFCPYEDCGKRLDDPDDTNLVRVTVDTSYWFTTEADHTSKQITMLGESSDAGFNAISWACRACDGDLTLPSDWDATW